MLLQLIIVTPLFTLEKLKSFLQPHISFSESVMSSIVFSPPLSTATCVVCSGASTKALSCTHSLCLQCFKSLNVLVESQTGKQWLSCPSCHTLVHLLDEQGKDSFSLNQKCSKHSKSLKIFCESCQELVCRNCTISLHRDHQYNLVEDTFPKHQQEIQAILEQMVKKAEALGDVLAQLETKEEDVIKCGDKAIEDVQSQIQGIVELVTHTGVELVTKINRVVQLKLEVLGQQKEEAEKALVQLEGCQEFVKQCLAVGSPHQILSEKHKMIEDMEVVHEQIRPEVFQPVEEANITFIGNSQILESYKNIGSVKYSLSPTDVESKFLVPDVVTVGEMVTATLSLQTKGVSYKVLPLFPITCYLMSPDNNSNTISDIQEIEAGKYEITFVPSKRGTHSLHVLIGDSSINGSPFSLKVASSFSQPVRIIKGLDAPCGLAIDKSGQLLVVEVHGKCITAFNQEGTKIQSFQGFTNPCGVAVTSDRHILVTDEHRLQKLTGKGHCVVSIGSKNKGDRTLQFNCPRGIAVSPITGLIYVTDYGNHRIQVIKSDLTYSHSIGGKGAEPGKLSHPQDVALDSEGNVFVANHYNHCIDAFTPEGKFLRRFGGYGSDKGRLTIPTSVAIDTSDNVYVADHSNHISLFNTRGEFLRHIPGDGQEELFSGPQYVAIDPLGTLYVVDGDNSIVVL